MPDLLAAGLTFKLTELPHGKRNTALLAERINTNGIKRIEAFGSPDTFNDFSLQREGSVAAIASAPLAGSCCR